VRKNLHDLLEVITDKVASAESQHVFFIDQLCINQQDVRERNHQVLQMASIFREAKDVLVWLGRENCDSHRVMAAIRKSATTRLKRERYIEAIDDLVRLEYWRRLWVIQEMMLAQSLELLWGWDTVNDDEFRSFLTYNLAGEKSISMRLEDSAWAEKERWRLHNLSRGLELTRAASGLRKPTNLSWEQALKITWGTSCEDLRDRVYGVLGLVRRTELQPDYSLSLEEVFHDLLKYGLSLERASWPGGDDYHDAARLWCMQLGLPDSTIIPKNHVPGKVRKHLNRKDTKTSRRSRSYSSDQDAVTTRAQYGSSKGKAWSIDGKNKKN
jgi:hypothetical protein